MDPIILNGVLHSVGFGATVVFIIMIIALAVYLYRSWLEIKNLKVDTKLKVRELAQ